MPNWHSPDASHQRTLAHQPLAAAGPAEDLGRVPQALDEDLGGGLDVVHPRSVPPPTLVDQNEMLALWITPRYRRAVAGNAHACTERSTDAVVPPELRLRRRRSRT